MLSRKKPAVGPGSGNTVSSAKDSKKKRKLPKLEDFLQMRDYTGASTLLEVMSMCSFLVIQSYFIPVTSATVSNLGGGGGMCTVIFFGGGVHLVLKTLSLF